VSGKEKRPFEVFVRWLDGYFEWFTADEIRISDTLIWLRLSKKYHHDGRPANRQIPLKNVRWYATYPENHESLYLDEIEDDKK
jgi:hypothetical protein